MRSEARQTPMIIIAGYFGYGNLGDEALLSGMLAELRHRFPAARFTVISGNPLETGNKHHVQAVSWSDGVGIRRSISLSDMVILGGGGLFHDYLGVNPQRLFDYGNLCYETLVSIAFDAALQGKPLMLYAVGVGPLFTPLGRSYLEMVVHLADVITVRDAESRRIIENMPLGAVKEVILTADPAFTLQPSHPTTARALIPEFTDLEGPLLAFVPRAWDLSADEGSWQRILVNVLDRFIEHTGGRVLMLPFQDEAADQGRDRTLCLNLLAQLKCSDRCQIMPPLSGPQQAAAVLDAADIVLSMRLHALIFAAITFTPMVSVAYDPKMSWLMDELSMLDHNHILEGLQDDQLLQSLLDCWHDRDQLSSQLNQCIQRLQQAAIRTAEIAADLLMDQEKDQKPSILVSDLLQQLAAFEKRNSDPAQMVILDQKLISCLEESCSAAVFPVISRQDEVVSAATAAGEAQGNHVEELIRILKAHPDVRGIILYPPILDWGFMFQRPQQIAQAMARAGYLFFYCSPNSYQDNIHGFRKIEQGLYLCNVPFNTFRLLPECILFLGSALHRPLLELFPEAFVVYDQFDDLSLSMGSHADHLAVLARADLILTSSPRLLDALPDQGDAILVPNAVDLEVWETNQSDISLDWKGKTLQGAGVVGYVGALAEWFDYPLLLDVAQLRPDLDFVLIGVDYDGSLERSGILRQPNVHWLGLLPHAEMRTYVNAFDVGMIPFRINRLILATSPVKLYEFMAAGKPIVSTPIPDCMRFEGVFIAENAEVFAAQLDLAIAAAKQDEAQQLLREQAEVNTWEQRAISIDQAITERTEDRLIRQDGYRKVPMDMLGTSLRELRDLRLKSADWQANVIRQEKIIAGLRDEVTVSQRETIMVQAALSEERKQIKDTEQRLQQAIRGQEREFRHRELLTRELYAIQTSRYWAVLSCYWRGRELFLRLSRNVRRLFSPIGFARLSRRLRKYLPAIDSPACTHIQTLLQPANEQDHQVVRSDKYVVVMLPIIDWDFRFQRPQQLARQFANHGHNVYYLKTNFRNGGRLQLQDRGKNVIQVEMIGPPDVNLYQDTLSELDMDVVLKGFEQLAFQEQMHEAVCIVQLPFWGPLAQRLRARFGWQVIYDCMDDHSGFSTNHPRMLELEQDLIKNCDLAIASAHKLLEHCAPAAEKILLPNAGDFQHFSAPVHSLPELSDFPRTDGPVIGYVGAIADWFDFDLLRPAISAHPEWTFVFIGSTWSADDHRDLLKLEHVHFLGEKSYSQLPDYLSRFDVSVIPFKLNKLTESTNPVKLYEYMAAGLPVVASQLPELEPFRSWVHLVEDGMAFRDAIEHSLQDDSAGMVQSRKQIAAEHTWEKRFLQLDYAIRELFGKVSIIIITWNNLDLTRECLRSLRETSKHPNLQIIIVDNGSEDETPEWLSAYAAGDSRVKLVLNPSNLGFAPAINQGLELASGDYVVLLNNDIVLTPGWLALLLRTLRDDRNIGMVGPVSNGAWNEAYLEPQYDKPEQINEFAFQHTGQYSGMVAPIKMLAMYCTAARKSVFDEVGLLDEGFAVGMFEDDDYALRIRAAGYRLAVAQDVYVHHHSRAGFKLHGERRYKQLFEMNRETFEVKWGWEWEPHESGDLHEERDFASQLGSIRKENSRRKDVIVFLDDGSENEFPIQRHRELAQAFARQGFLVFLEDRQLDQKGFQALANGCYLANVAAIAYDELNRPYLFGTLASYGRSLQFRRPRWIYDFTAQAEEQSKLSDLFAQAHARLLQQAEVVAVNSGLQYQRLSESHSRFLHVPDGSCVQDYVRDDQWRTDVPQALSRILALGKPLVGYHGPFNGSCLDLDLLQHLIMERQDVSFILSVPGDRHEMACRRILEYANVFRIDPVNAVSLPAFLQWYDAAIMPVNPDSVTRLRARTMVYNYLAAGVAIVCTQIPECHSHTGLFIASSPGEFSANLGQALAEVNNLEFRTAMQRFSQCNSWDERVRQIIMVLDRSG